MHDAAFFQKKFQQAVSYDDFVAMGKADGHHLQWLQRHSQLELTPDQFKLVSSFSRTMNILCLTGTWCGDCALQGAAMQRIAEANPDHINLRFLLRSEEHADIVVPNQINAGFRVPITFFLAEDFEPVSQFGDRTLSRYRSMARKALPPGAVTILEDPLADPVRAVLDEVLEEFERVHLLLRLSGRFRKKYGD